MPDQQHTPPLCLDRAIAVTEDVVYSVLAIGLVGGAAILIGDAVVHLVDEAGRKSTPPCGTCSTGCSWPSSWWSSSALSGPPASASYVDTRVRLDWPAGSTHRLRFLDRA